ATFTSPYLDLDGAPNEASEFGEEEGLKPAVINIVCEKGISKLNVRIESDYLTKDFLESVMLTNEFDLANPGAYKEGLEGLGFKTGDDVVGQTELDFDITQFMPLIMEAGDHKFHITVTDADGDSSAKTLLIHKS
ncbi:MAG: hypothetical protein K2K36_02695, partial [Muribaculaceae bacterium]|nr:hypothetical protein [Muribaculaceae bacterium]